MLWIYLLIIQGVDHPVQKPNFPECPYWKVVLYELNGDPGHYAESVFNLQTGESRELEPYQVAEFIQIITSPESYGFMVAACHDPRIGLVFYGKNDEICAYLSLCLACNNIYTIPGLRLGLEYSGSGFSLKTRKKLREIFARWRFPDEHYTLMFDHPLQVRMALEDHGLDSLQIEEQLKLLPNVDWSE